MRRFGVRLSALAPKSPGISTFPGLCFFSKYLVHFDDPDFADQGQILHFAGDSVHFDDPDFADQGQILHFAGEAVYQADDSHYRDTYP